MLRGGDGVRPHDNDNCNNDDCVSVTQRGPPLRFQPRGRICRGLTIFRFGATILQNASLEPFLNAVATMVCGCFLYRARTFLPKPSVRKLHSEQWSQWKSNDRTAQKPNVHSQVLDLPLPGRAGPYVADSGLKIQGQIVVDLLRFAKAIGKANNKVSSEQKRKRLTVSCSLMRVSKNKTLDVVLLFADSAQHNKSSIFMKQTNHFCCLPFVSRCALRSSAGVDDDRWGVHRRVPLCFHEVLRVYPRSVRTFRSAWSSDCGEGSHAASSCQNRCCRGVSRCWYNVRQFVMRGRTAVKK